MEAVVLLLALRLELRVGRLGLALGRLGRGLLLVGDALLEVGRVGHRAPLGAPLGFVWPAWEIAVIFIQWSKVSRLIV